MSKKRRGKKKLTAAQKRAKRERRENTQIIFLNGKQKRVPREKRIEGLPEYEYLARTADPVWLMENGYYELLYQREQMENPRDDLPASNPAPVQPPSSPAFRLESIQELTRRLMRAAVGPGDRVLDGTVGNGHDTFFLAHCVGPRGKVVGFDVQLDALAETEGLLNLQGLSEQVSLVHDSHEWLGLWLDTHWPGQKLAGAMFNLGYRPRGDHAIMTRPQSTLAALEQVINYLRPGGLLTVALYTGHEGGAEEAAAVLDFMRGLPPNLGQVVWHQFLNRAHPPSLVAFCKK